MEGAKKCKRASSYLAPPIPPSRVGCEKEGNLSTVGSNPSGDADLTVDTGSDDVHSVHSSQDQLTVDTTDSPRERVHSKFPVAAVGLMPLWTNAPISDTDIGRTSVSQDETPQEVNPPEDDGRTSGGQLVAGDCLDNVVTGRANAPVTPEGVQQEDPPEWSDYRSAFRCLNSDQIIEQTCKILSMSNNLCSSSQKASALAANSLISGMIIRNKLGGAHSLDR